MLRTTVKIIICVLITFNYNLCFNDQMLTTIKYYRFEILELWFSRNITRKKIYLTFILYFSISVEFDYVCNGSETNVVYLFVKGLFNSLSHKLTFLSIIFELWLCLGVTQNFAKAESSYNLWEGFVVFGEQRQLKSIN